MLQLVNRVLLNQAYRGLFIPARHKVYYGGRGSAKSHSIAEALVIIAATENKFVVCARQFMSSIRESSKALLEQKIRALGLLDQFSITLYEIVHRTTGSRFVFIGLDRNPEAHKSLEGADICWVEEAENISAKSMEILIPTIRNPGSEIWWSFNPAKRDAPVEMFRDRKEQALAKSLGETWIVQEVSYRNNMHFYLTPLATEMEHMRLGNPARYRHIWLGDYDDGSVGRIFQQVESRSIDERFLEDNYVPARYGLDLGSTTGDPYAATRVYVIEQDKAIDLDLLPQAANTAGIVYVSRESGGNISLDEVPAMLDSVVDERADQINVDHRADTIEWLQKPPRNFSNAIAARKGPGSVKHGLLWLQSYTIIIDPDCRELLQEAELYSWMVDRRTGKSLGVPVDTHNHYWDSVRYACSDAMVEPGESDDEDDGVVTFKL